MALSKEIDTPMGVPATYWRIAKVTFNAKVPEGTFDRKLKVLMEGFLNQEAKEAGCDPLVSHWVVIPHYILTPEKNFLTVLYQILKTDPLSDFFEAESDTESSVLSPVVTRIEE